MSGPAGAVAAPAMGESDPAGAVAAPAVGESDPAGAVVAPAVGESDPAGAVAAPAIGKTSAEAALSGARRRNKGGRPKGSTKANQLATKRIRKQSTNWVVKTYLKKTEDCTKEEDESGEGYAPVDH